MKQTRWKDLYHLLAEIHQESQHLTWQTIFQKVLQLFRELSEATQIALVVPDSQLSETFSLTTPPTLTDDLYTLCATIHEPAAEQAHGLHKITLPETDTEIWRLPIPPQSSPALAILIMQGIKNVPPRDLVEKGSCLLTPLIQHALLQKSLTTERRDNLHERQNAFIEATQALGETVEVTELLKQMGKTALDIMQADQIVILPVEKYLQQKQYCECETPTLMDFAVCIYRQYNDVWQKTPNQTLHINNIEDEGDPLASIAKPLDIHTTLSIPLYAHQRHLGILVACKKSIAPFKETEITLGKALAAQATITLSNAYLFQQEQDQRGLTNAMAHATTSLAQILNQDQVLDQILEQIQRVLPHDTSNVMLIEEDSARIVRWRGYDRFGHQDTEMAAVKYPLDLPNLKKMLETREPQIIPDTQNAADWIVKSDFEWLRSYAGVPISIGEQVMGFINIDSNLPGRFNQKHAQRLKTFADYAAIAIQNSQLYQSAQLKTSEITRLLKELRHRQTRLEQLNHLISKVNSVVTLNDILNLGLEQALKIAEMVRGRIYIFDQAAQMLKLHVHKGIPEQDIAFFSIYTPGQGTTGRAFANQQVIVENDPLKAKTAFLPESIDELQSQISLPLIVDRQAVGVISLNTSRGHTVTPEIEQLLQAIADQLALAIQRGQLTAQMQKQLKTVHYLYETSSAFMTQMRTEGIIFIILRTLTDHIKGSRGSAFYQTKNDSWIRLRTYSKQRAVRERWLPGEIWEGEAEFLDACQEERMLVLISKQRENVPLAWEQFEELGTKRVFYFPITLPNKECFGIISVLVNEERDLAPYESALVWTVVQQGAAALARVTLYEASQKSEGRLHAILESSLDGILLVGQDQTISYVNSQVLQLLELQGDFSNWEGNPLTDIIAATHEGSPQFAYWLSDSAEQRWDINELPSKEKKHPIFETSHGLSIALQHWPVYADQKELLGSLFLIRDVTEQKALERMRDDLLNMIVHDMRNPLSVIQNAMQIIKDPDMRDAIDEVIDIASSNTTRLLDLVNTILDIGRLESGRFELYQEALMLPELLQSIAKNIITPNQHLDLRIEVDETCPILWADQAIVTRILQNLLSNALKFVTEEQDYIRISTTTEEDWVTLEVYNSGPHIPPEVYQRLFKKFTAGNYAKRGYGLGLAFCRLATEAHGGKIWAKNQEPRGVSFYFTLPTTVQMLTDFDYLYET